MSTKSMINQHIQTVLDKMGWTDDAFVPMANDQNRQLMQRMQQLLNEKGEKSNLNEQLQDRVKWLKGHYQNTETDIQQNLVCILKFKRVLRFFFKYVLFLNQKLLDAHRCQWDAESHMYKVAENERTSLVKQIKNCVKKTDELKETDDFTKGTVN